MNITANDRYRLLDSGNGEKLEQVGAYRLIRPAAQAVWKQRLRAEEWAKADATFRRFKGGDGEWRPQKGALPQCWNISHSGVVFKVQLTDFGHLGIFPEQETNWDLLRELIVERTKVRSEPVRVLNLFAYTGGSSLACAAAGSQVTHVDASKTSVGWARENAELSGLQSTSIRWLVDDVTKFVAREIRRGATYDAVILDPPSYGRGPKGEVWKIEDHLVPLLEDLAKVLSNNYLFALLSAHSPGYTPIALENLAKSILPRSETLEFRSAEMIIEEQEGPLPRLLPSGASCLAVRRG